MVSFISFGDKDECDWHAYYIGRVGDDDSCTDDMIHTFDKFVYDIISSWDGIGAMYSFTSGHPWCFYFFHYTHVSSFVCMVSCSLWLLYSVVIMSPLLTSTYISYCYMVVISCLILHHYYALFITLMIHIPEHHCSILCVDSSSFVTSTSTYIFDEWSKTLFVYHNT